MYAKTPFAMYTVNIYFNREVMNLYLKVMISRLRSGIYGNIMLYTINVLAFKGLKRSLNFVNYCTTIKPLVTDKSSWEVWCSCDGLFGLTNMDCGRVFCRKDRSLLTTGFVSSSSACFFSWYCLNISSLLSFSSNFLWSDCSCFNLKKYRNNYTFSSTRRRCFSNHI